MTTATIRMSRPSCQRSSGSGSANRFTPPPRRGSRRRRPAPGASPRRRGPVPRARRARRRDNKRRSSPRAARGRRSGEPADKGLARRADQDRPSECGEPPRAGRAAPGCVPASSRNRSPGRPGSGRARRRRPPRAPVPWPARRAPRPADRRSADLLHGPRRPRMCISTSAARRRRRPRRAGVEPQRRDVVDDRGAGGQRGGRNRALVVSMLTGRRRARPAPGPRAAPAAFPPTRDRLRAGARGLAADVEDVCAGGRQLQPVRDGRCRVEMRPPVREGIGRDIDDAHHRGATAQRQHPRPGRYGEARSATVRFLDHRADRRRLLRPAAVAPTPRRQGFRQ